MKKQKQAFTLVELIVSIMIVAILSSIGFYSYIGYLNEARDTERKANVGEIKTSLKLYKQKRGAYPDPGNAFSILNNGKVVASQGLFDENVILSTMDSMYIDPFTQKNYFYSVTKNRQEFEIALTLENGDFPIALLEGTYKTVSKTVLPSIVLATGSTTPIEIHIGVGNGTNNRNLFIMNGGINLPYNSIKPYVPIYGGIDLDTVLAEGNVKFWQNSDYRTCTAIGEAAKYIHNTGTETYQILNNSGSLINTGCLLP